MHESPHTKAIHGRTDMRRRDKDTLLNKTRKLQHAAIRVAADRSPIPLGLDELANHVEALKAFIERVKKITR
jgi:hypothetical protein